MVLTIGILRVGCPRLQAFMTNLTIRRTKIISSTSSRISVFMSWHIPRRTWLMPQVCTLPPCAIDFVASMVGFGTDIWFFYLVLGKFKAL